MSDILELTGLSEEEKRFIRQQTEEKGVDLAKPLIEP